MIWLFSIICLFLVLVLSNQSMLRQKPNYPHWPWMGPVDIEGHLHQLRLKHYLRKLQKIGVESILDITFVERSDLEEMSMSLEEMKRFISGKESIKKLKDSIEFVYEWPMLHEIEKTNEELLKSFEKKAFYQVVSFFDQSLLVIDEKRSLDLTGIRSLQTMKQISNEMSTLILKWSTLPLFNMTVNQVLKQNDDGNTADAKVFCS